MRTRRPLGLLATCVLGTCLLGTLAGPGFLGAGPIGAGTAHAQDPDPPTTIAAGSAAPLIAVPPGCALPPAPAAVFVGTLLRHDASTARFRVDQVRSGSTAPWEVAGQIDVRYGNEVRFLDLDERYLVGAAIDPETNALSSKVAEHTPLFGGSSVIGLNESDIDCPALEDGLRTLWVDGTTIDSGVLTPLRDSKSALLGAVLKPAAWAFAILVVLVVMKHLMAGFVRSMRDGSGGSDGSGLRRDRVGARR